MSRERELHDAECVRVIEEQIASMTRREHAAGVMYPLDGFGINTADHYRLKRAVERRSKELSR